VFRFPVFDLLTILSSLCFDFVFLLLISLFLFLGFVHHVDLLCLYRLSIPLLIAILIFKSLLVSISFSTTFSVATSISTSCEICRRQRTPSPARRSSKANPSLCFVIVFFWFCERQTFFFFPLCLKLFSFIILFFSFLSFCFPFFVKDKHSSSLLCFVSFLTTLFLFVVRVALRHGALRLDQAAANQAVSGGVQQLADSPDLHAGERERGKKIQIRQPAGTPCLRTQFIFSVCLLSLMRECIVLCICLLSLM
jgi:hypothetical protein